MFVPQHQMAPAVSSAQECDVAAHTLRALELRGRWRAKSCDVQPQPQQ
jgi:hypothetical protein